MKQMLISVVGLPASGKSTLVQKMANEFKFNLIDGTPVRHFLNEHIAFYADPGPRGTPANDSFKRIVNLWRDSLAYELIDAGESVILEGGLDRQRRQSRYVRIKKDHPVVVLVTIYCQVAQDEHKRRLTERGGDWLAMMDSYFKAAFEAPESNEYDTLLIYDQSNTQDIFNALQKLGDGQL